MIQKSSCRRLLLGPIVIGRERIILLRFNYCLTCEVPIVIGRVRIILLWFNCCFGSLNITQISPNFEHTSLLAKNCIIPCHWARVWPAGSVAPPNILACLPHAHRWTKFVTQIPHDQTQKKVVGSIPSLQQEVNHFDVWRHCCPIHALS